MYFVYDFTNCLAMFAIFYVLVNCGALNGHGAINLKSCHLNSLRYDKKESLNNRPDTHISIE